MKFSKTQRPEVKPQPCSFRIARTRHLRVLYRADINTPNIARILKSEGASEITLEAGHVYCPSTTIPAVVTPGIIFLYELHSCIAAKLGQQIHAPSPPFCPTHSVHFANVIKAPPFCLVGGANTLHELASPHLASITAVAPPPPQVHVALFPEMSTLARKLHGGQLFVSNPDPQQPVSP
jgi:hypothetical protein